MLMLTRGVRPSVRMTTYGFFQNAMRSLGLVVEEAVCREVVRFYDVDGDGEMKYQPLIEDVARGQRHFLHHPGPSARFEDQPLGRRAPLTPFIKLFLKKLKMKLHAQVGFGSCVRFYPMPLQWLLFFLGGGGSVTSAPVAAAPRRGLVM